MIKWKKEYELGVAEIDEQHKYLVEISNSAYEILNNKFYTDKYDKIVDIIKELENYTIFHFQYEENYMQENKYKKFLSHKVEHDDFIKAVKNIDFKKMDYNQNEYLLELINFIVDWLVNHILQKDKMIIEDAS